MTMAIQRKGKTAIFSLASNAFSRNDREHQAKAVQNAVLRNALSNMDPVQNLRLEFQVEGQGQVRFSLAVMAAPMKARIRTRWWVYLGGIADAGMRKIFGRSLP